MYKLILAIAGALLLSASALAQTPSIPAETSSLTWMQGARVHTNPNGTLVYEAFIGPVNGVVTGTALTVLAAGGAYTEYHKIGPNAEGVYGLDIANTRNGMKWSFTPLKAIEPGRITFQTTDGALTIAYFSDDAGGVRSQVDRVADGKTTTQEWHFLPLPASQ
ncbi:MAG: hypothetical protein Q8R82_00915 [Hyphomonadaceae bacterium]|nr:hypothetical protein [Hyphomonadaceae bacterium]